MAFIPYLVIVPLAAAFLIPILGRKIKLAGEMLANTGALCLVALSFVITSSLGADKVIVYKFGKWAGPGGISLIVDSFSALMLITMNFVAFMVSIYSIGYMKKYTDTWKFYTLLMVMLAGINGVLIAGDIFNLYIFLEIAAIAGYFLVAFGTDADELEASFKYAVMGTVASAFILLGIAFLYSYTSTLNMADMASVFITKGPARVLPFVTVLFLMGFGLKAALAPFHAWLPYAHSSAPAPVSAMLSGVSIKVLGVYALARIFFNVFGMNGTVSMILITLAVISMIVGSILAFGQTDIKRLFAYSSISQIGYIVLGLALATPLGILGAIFHIFNHSLFKSLLFLNSGAIENAAGTRDLGRIKGMAVKSPVAAYTNLIGSLSICGMPPLGGFWSKLVIIFACLEAKRPELAFIAAIVGMLTIAYYFRALTPVLFEKDPDGKRKKMSWAMAIPMVILAFLTAFSALILLPNAGNSLLNGAVLVLSNGKEYAASIMGVVR